MTAFADTSFLFAFYFPRTDSDRAIAKVDSLRGSILISSLVRFEFRQAVWFKVWLHAKGEPLGLNQAAAQTVLATFELDLEEGLWKVVYPDWERTVFRAEKLAVDQVPRRGVRSMAVLHIVFAIEAGVSDFLSFDENQRSTALAEGFQVGP